MKCELFEDLIPLYVGEDLEPPRADDLRQHLTGCAHCRRVTEDFQASQNWLTGFTVPDFDEASFAKMRGSVLSKIERQIEQEITQQEKRGRWIGWLLPKWTPRLALVISAAAFAVVTVLSVAAYRSQIVTPKPGGDTVAKTGIPVSTDDGQSKTLAENRVSGDRISTATGGDRISTATVRERRFPKSKRSESVLPEEASNNGGLSFPLEPPVIGPEQTEPEAAAQAEPEDKEPKEMLRIELQTADPNIRIIWLTPKTPSPSVSKTK